MELVEHGAAAVALINMLIINCPYCGPEINQNFQMRRGACKRPDGSKEIGDREWGEYVFIRANPKVCFMSAGYTHGCRKWFNCVRDTSTDEILVTYKLDEKTKFK